MSSHDERLSEDWFAEFYRQNYIYAKRFASSRGVPSEVCGDLLQDSLVTFFGALQRAEVKVGDEDLEFYKIVRQEVVKHLALAKGEMRVDDESPSVLPVEGQLIGRGARSSDGDSFWSVGERGLVQSARLPRFMTNATETVLLLWLPVRAALGKDLVYLFDKSMADEPALAARVPAGSERHRSSTVAIALSALPAVLASTGLSAIAMVNFGETVNSLSWVSQVMLAAIWLVASVGVFQSIILATAGLELRIDRYVSTLEPQWLRLLQCVEVLVKILKEPSPDTVPVWLRSTSLRRLDELLPVTALTLGLLLGTLAGVVLATDSPLSGALVFFTLLSGAGVLAWSCEPVAIPAEAPPSTESVSEPTADEFARRPLLIDSPPPNRLFRWIETPHGGRVELWREIPAGEFMMGSLENVGEVVEWPRHPVRILSPFRIMAVPVTNAQYAAFNANDANMDRPNHPVGNISWHDAVRFCTWLSRTYAWAHGARLPTEEEWEYACRAGTATRYWSGDEVSDLDRVGWYRLNSGSRTHAVGEKPANVWGLYDVHGNIWEWTASLWLIRKYKDRSQSNPFMVDPTEEAGNLSTSGNELRTFRGGHVLRGGCCWDSAEKASSAFRESGGSGSRFDFQGFRVLLPPLQKGRKN